MEFRELRSLILLADCGSLSGTARTLNLTPAAIHKQLKQLEQELGVPLYERSAGGLRLTAAADLLLPYLRGIQSQYNSAVEALEEWRGLRRGLLRIGAGPSLGTYLLPEILKTFRERYPGIDLDLQTGSSFQLIGALQSGGLDLALVVAPEEIEEPNLEIALEAATEIALVTTIPSVPRKATLETVRKHPFLLFRKGARIDALITHYWAQHGLSPNVIARFDSAEALKAFLLSGAGVAMLPLYTVKEDIRTGRLKRIRLKEPPLMMKIHLLGRKSGYVPPAVTEFTRIARKALDSSIGPAKLP